MGNACLGLGLGLGLSAGTGAKTTARAESAAAVSSAGSATPKSGNAGGGWATTDDAQAARDFAWWNLRARELQERGGLDLEEGPVFTCQVEEDDDDTLEDVHDVLLFHLDFIVTQFVVYGAPMHLKSITPVQRREIERVSFQGARWRVVPPYVFEFKTHCKARWRGRRLADAMREEFSGGGEGEGVVQVNGEEVGPDYVLREGDELGHAVHRHEPPVGFVGGADMVVAQGDESVVLVNKPPGLPVHPGGAYRCNTVEEILKAEGGLEGGVHVVHRLDRPTSGLLLMARTPERARELATLMQEKRLRKVYVAKVRGRFPESRKEVVDVHTGSVAVRSEGSALAGVNIVVGDDGELELEVSFPVCVVNHKRGVHGLSLNAPDAKPSTSRFKLVRYDADSDTSLVRCSPVTGRSHQLRLHLQKLGHVIVGDDMYGDGDGGGGEPPPPPPVDDGPPPVDDGPVAAPPPGLTLTQRLEQSCRECKHAQHPDLPGVSVRFLPRMTAPILHLHAVRLQVRGGEKEEDWRVPLPSWWPQDVATIE